MTTRSAPEKSSRFWISAQMLTAALSSGWTASVTGSPIEKGVRQAVSGDAIYHHVNRTLTQHATHDGHVRNHLSPRPERPHVTMMLSNYARPRNVETIVEAVCQYEAVDEILVWDVHGRQHDAPNISHFPKTWVIHTPETRPMEKWGMLTRLKGCLLAENEMVFFQDDDWLVSEAAIKGLVESKMSEPDRVSCYVGRGVEHDIASNRYSYVLKDLPAPSYVPICLPHAMLTDRRFCEAALRKAPLMEDIGRQGRPYWSAEDIWHSLVAINTTGNPNLLLTTPEGGLTGLDASHGIHSSVDPTGIFNWQDFRSMFAHEAITRLSLGVEMTQVVPL